MRTDHSRIWLMTLLLGAGLSWPLPLGGVLLAVAASFGLVISWEAGELDANSNGLGAARLGGSVEHLAD